MTANGENAMNGESEISIATEAVEIVTAQFALRDGVTLVWQGPRETITGWLRNHFRDFGFVELPASPEFGIDSGSRWLRLDCVQYVYIYRYEDYASEIAAHRTRELKT